MIEDPTWWHAWNDKLGVAGWVVAGITATMVGIWRLAAFTRQYTTKDHLNIRLAQQEEKGRKELELCNVIVQGEVAKVRGAMDTLAKTNDTKHDALDEKLDIVIGLVKNR